MIKSRSATTEYRDGWDRIFGKKPVPTPVEDVPTPPAESADEYEPQAADEYEGSAPD
jgi:hypothetical protein